jgi:hypothetical protein
MDTKTAGLFASLLIGAVGAGLFIYGKRQSRWPQLAVGVVLCLYPYFVPNVWAMLGIAVALLVLVWVLARMGH